MALSGLDTVVKPLFYFPTNNPGPLTPRMKVTHQLKQFPSLGHTEETAQQQHGVKSRPAALWNYSEQYKRYRDVPQPQEKGLPAYGTYTGASTLRYEEIDSSITPLTSSLDPVTNRVRGPRVLLWSARESGWKLQAKKQSVVRIALSCAAFMHLSSNQQKHTNEINSLKLMRRKRSHG